MVKNIPKKERPRERLINNGVSNLSNSELLSIIFKSGTKDCSVIFMANEVLSTIDNISNLKNATINTLTKIKGIGTVKAATLLAALELGKRVYYEVDGTSIKLNNVFSIYNYFNYLLRNKKQEFFYVVLLDNKKNLIDTKLLFVGTINKSVVHPRELFKEAILNSASSIICVHNHPSGDSTPSPEDKEITKTIKSVGETMNIPLVDHIIIGKNNYFSFYENNII